MIQNCCICGNVVTQWVKSLNAWSKWCSSSCRGKDPEILEKKRQTNQRLFGGHPCIISILFQNEQVIV